VCVCAPGFVGSIMYISIVHAGNFFWPGGGGVVVVVVMVVVW